jgi:hypothetical protein
MTSPKLMIEEKLIYLYDCLLADAFRLVISAKSTSNVCDLARSALISTSSRLTSAALSCSDFFSAILNDTVLRLQEDRIRGVNRSREQRRDGEILVFLLNSSLSRVQPHELCLGCLDYLP